MHGLEHLANNINGFTRRPTSHCCDCILELPSTYVYNTTLRVLLGIQLLNENKTDEMRLIMKNLHNLVSKKINYHLDEDIDCMEECINA